MAVLLPIEDLKHAAVYDGKVLTIEVAGEIPGAVVGEVVRRDDWMGGLHFSLVGFFTGFGKHPAQKINIDYKEVIELPIPNFNNKSVLLETAEGTDEIPIRYTGFIPAPNDDDRATEPPKRLMPSVLKPIHLYLPGGELGEHVVDINAALAEHWKVILKWDQNLLSIWHTQASPKLVRYFLTWLKTPHDIKDPTLVNVMTSPLLQDISGKVDSLGAGTIQPYLIHYVFTEAQK